jgi:formylglycine-generating enzyme required for sulfatase activity
VRRSGIVVLFGCAFVACGLFPDLGDLSGDGGGIDVVSLNDAAGNDASEAGPSSDASDADVTAVKCLGDAGPTPVAAATFCIDSTEVTNAQYAAFIATNPSLAGLPPTCSGWKTTFAQSTKPLLGTEDYPAVFVDWCDAWAYCAWAGKRLCGRLDGGSLATTAMNDVTQDAWYVACSHNGAFTYPYGGAFDASVCNGPERDSGTVLPASAIPNCVGGYAGVANMVGNADEWIDSCKTSSSGPEAGADNCERRSGSWSDPDGSLQTCSFARTGPRQLEDDDIGFRCCSDIAP